MKIPTPTKGSDGLYKIRLRLNGKDITVRGTTAAECKREATAIKAEHLTGRVRQQICKRNGLPEVGVHGLRHSAVSLAYHLGWSELTSMRVFGYSDYNTMRKIYTHLADADRKKDVQSMSNFFAVAKSWQNEK